MALVDDNVKLVKIRRGGTILRVPEDEVDRYFNDGFDVIGENGKVVRAAISNDPALLQKLLLEARAEIEKLNKIIETQSEEIASLKKVAKTTSSVTRKKTGKE